MLTRCWGVRELAALRRRKSLALSRAWCTARVAVFISGLYGSSVGRAKFSCVDGGS